MPVSEPLNRSWEYTIAIPQGLSGAEIAECILETEKNLVRWCAEDFKVEITSDDLCWRFEKVTDDWNTVYKVVYRSPQVRLIEKMKEEAFNEISAAANKIALGYMKND